MSAQNVCSCSCSLHFISNIASFGNILPKILKVVNGRYNPIYLRQSCYERGRKMPGRKVILLVGVAIVVVTIVFGRFFCGWICPFGLYMDLFTLLRKSMKLGYWNLSKKWNWNLHKLRYAIVAAILVLPFFLGPLDPRVWLSSRREQGWNTPRQCRSQAQRLCGLRPPRISRCKKSHARCARVCRDASTRYR